MLAGSDAAPAGRRRTLLLHPGGAGAPPGDTRIPCEELADGGPSRLARGSKDAATQKGPPSPGRRQGETVNRKARPGAVRKTPRWSAERRARLARRAHAARRGFNRMRRSALRPLAVCEGQEEGPANGAGTTAHPAPQRIRAMVLGC